MLGMARGLLAELSSAFEAHRDAERARGMASYMRDQFPYYGIPAPEQRVIAREILANHEKPDEAQLKAIALACWGRREREWQYFACDLLVRHASNVSARFITTAKTLVSTKSWWDTVDSLAIRTVGPLVRSHPALQTTMDRWIANKNIWLARTAILHQISYKKDTDAERLFDYCARRAHDREFFIRKAIGWALREYSKTDERAVRSFVRLHRSELSGLSQREALKWLERSSIARDRGGSGPASPREKGSKITPRPAR